MLQASINVTKIYTPQNIIGTKILAGSFGADTDINIYYGVAWRLS